MTSTILLAIDGSSHGWKALEVAADLANSRGARIVALHVVPLEPMPQGLRAFARIENLPVEEEYARWHDVRLLGDAITQEAEKRLKGHAVAKVAMRVVEGPVVPGILEAAGEEQAAMIVLGSRGLSDAAGLFLGSVAHKVSHLATCTVVVVK